MRQEVRFLLAITLMIMVLVGTNLLFPPIPPEEMSGPEGDAPGLLDGSGDVGAPSPPLSGANAGGATPGDVAPPFGGPTVPEPSPVFRPEVTPVAAAEETVLVEGPLYRFEWSTTGARLISARLLQFENFDEGAEGPVELLVAESGGALAMQLRLGEFELDLGSEAFEVEPAGGLRLNEGGGPRTLTFRYRHHRTLPPPRRSRGAVGHR